MKVETPKVGELYHLSWAFSRGVVGRCIAVNEEAKTVTLRAPKTKIEFKCPVKWEDLRYTRKEQVRQLKKRK